MEALSLLLILTVSVKSLTQGWGPPHLISGDSAGASLQVTESHFCSSSYLPYALPKISGTDSMQGPQLGTRVGRPQRHFEVTN